MGTEELLTVVNCAIAQIKNAPPVQKKTALQGETAVLAEKFAIGRARKALGVAESERAEAPPANSPLKKRCRDERRDHVAAALFVSHNRLSREATARLGTFPRDSSDG